jgi:hypothetical protein
MMVSAMSIFLPVPAGRGPVSSRGAGHPLRGVLARQGDYRRATQIGQQERTELRRQAKESIGIFRICGRGGI